MVAMTYVVVVLGGIFWHYSRTGDTYTLEYSLTLPTTWIAVVVASAVAWGLWQRKRWGWSLGLAAAIVQLLSMLVWLVPRFSLTGLPSAGVLLVLALLITFIALLLLPGTKAICSR